MIKIVIDAFGGDNAPSEIVKGAILAVNKNDDVHIVLAGDKDKILPLLESEKYNKEHRTMLSYGEYVSSVDK